MAKYFQTWTWNVSLSTVCRKCALLWQWLCGLFGHQISKTEWGYGGGETADVWCRWCNKLMKIPKTELMFRLGEKRSLLKMVDQRDEGENS